MFLLVAAHPGFPGEIPQSRKTVVCCVLLCVCVLLIFTEYLFLFLSLLFLTLCVGHRKSIRPVKH